MRYFMTEIRVGDWRAAVGWYRAVLGLRVVLEDAPGEFALLEVGPAGGRLALKGGAGDHSGGREVVRLVFEVDDLEQWQADLTTHGVAVTGPIASAEGYREIRFADPDGTPIGFFAWAQPAPKSQADRPALRDPRGCCG